ncbi:MAG: PilN domain-containing protein [Polyangiaceae bacterium]|nr:PilN domain-containing protein [Polyangiaceae bacterium]
MIKINLLPDKTRTKGKKTSEASQVWLVVILVVCLAEVAGLFVFHGFKESELAEQTQKNAIIQKQIDQAKTAVADHAKVKEKLAQLRAREDAIAELQSARTGPTAMLLELARILTPGRGPSVNPDQLNKLRRDNPLAIYNPAWDARRLWISDLKEESRKLSLRGIARDGEDVSELARRLNLSSYFTDVKLLPAKQVTVVKSGPQLIEFNLEAMARY